MYRTQFNEGTLIIDRNEIRFEIPCERINVHSLDEVERLKSFPYGLPINLMELENDVRTFVMHFEPEANCVPITRFKSIATEKQKLFFSKEALNLANYLRENDDINTVLEASNIFIHEEGEIKLVYRGIKKLMPAIGFNEEALETQIKRLILFMFSAAKFEELRLNGLNIANNKSFEGWHEFVRKILMANTFESINKIVDEEFERFEQEPEIKKSKFKMPFMKNKTIDNESKEEKKAKKEKEKQLQKEQLEREKQLQKEEKEKRVLKVKSKAEETESIRNERKKDKEKYIKFNFKPIGIGIGAVLIICLGIVFFSNTTFFAKATSTGDTPKEMTKEDIETHVLKGLRYSSIQQYDDAIKEYEKIPYKSLDMEAKKSLLFAYLMTNNFQKALDKDPDFDESIVSYLLAKDRAKEIRDLESKSDVIIFEQAVSRNDRTAILKHYKKVKMNGRREGVVANAFVGEEKFKEAFDFAQEHNNKELMKNIKKAEKEYYEKKEMNPDEKKIKVENLQKEIDEMK
ncbi:type VII secretion protein EssB/YukC [Bacillus thuringiensis]|uniref:Uncharacterized protein n=1 Tax=Bacillus cereus (strain VD146) TaxID=1053236 RepID=R8MD80_BACCX|nr:MULTISPECIES: type VII secretion protein EssB/YukC [Bacillus cereus group]EOP32345.1 hypothetical protein IK1_05881 [Bacillus cereus VD146]MDZ3956247.1 type VII secretion protein EssB/YukC [Bacillus thuringiensis]RGP43383.1 hypothetical protein BTW32_29675 [Bacillus thuringiensis]